MGVRSWQIALAAGLIPAVPALAAGPLAELPSPGNFISPIRVLLILVAMIPWLLFCQWLDKDLSRLRKMNQEMWNGIVLGGGIAGLAIWIFLPWQTAGLFAAGFGLWFVVTVGVCGTYVLIRNSQVDAPNRVFTPRHIKAWFASLGSKKKESGPSLAFERVKLTGADKKKVPVPQDPNQTASYEAAQNLLFDALWRRATEVEMLIGANGLRVAYRVDGVVTPRNDVMPREVAEQAAAFLKRIAGLDPEEKRKPQQGQIFGTIPGASRGETKIEVLSSGTTQHERLALKIIGDENRLRIADLGLTQAQREAFDSLLTAPGGLILVSGPKASGVTTTLYAALRCHDAFMENLLTLEQQPLMELENITQYRYDSTKHEGSYARQLQTVLRREPDVVMVSDCLDRETAHLAVTAARGGKRIYMGVQAKDSFDALKRVLSLAGDTDGVAEALRGILSQRLLRKLCVACRIAYKPDPQLLKKANLPIDKIEHFYRTPRPEECVDEKGNPKICPNCQGSGYFGRTGIFEIMTVNDAVREQIKAGQPVNSIRAAARKAGMLYLQEIGMQKVIEGTTSVNEMLRVIRDEEAKPGQ
ncbi:MAG TPA: ATPase, T2SS/T4P/T4SS family [Phycisphaerae bacterium]|nr:ATPase, T2SS/T4P/T4SS family [Phycisphaerae bacterium]HOJ75819.1 ATPase, T2SS/T4P/T4SS family [Phycisphaerae bacterium]HOM53205.1 ATPase, T2SS/T4P/T4SS family [Phycisphaerae bacterium]HON67464.1 ATPase, T2SS/T4P/T4SS family [Phycisphaerae bacterium]HOQ87963.1 ATPase, T2SS/T4P/T4SS family [Phycisphaerae bacterium]